MKQGLLLFNPYIGDTFLSTAMSRKFSKLLGFDVLVASINDEMYDIGQDFFNGTTVTGTKLAELMKEASTISIPLRNNYDPNDLHKFTYWYDFKPEDKDRLTKLCLEVLEELEYVGYTDLFILHFSFPFALLGSIAKEQGYNVHGYHLLTTYGNGFSYLLMTDGYGDSKPAVIWSKDFIGDRLSKMVTGHSMDSQDFVISIPTWKGIRKSVSLFPTTRSNGLPTAGNWHLDGKILYEKGYTYHNAYYHKEDTLDIPGHNHFYYSMGEMAQSICESQFIVCNDSASFHLAWYYNVPAIVKLKGGFNHEWVPPWVRNNPRYQFIDPIKMFDEEYYRVFNQKLEALEI